MAASASRRMVRPRGSACSLSARSPADDGFFFETGEKIHLGRGQQYPALPEITAQLQDGFGGVVAHVGLAIFKIEKITLEHSIRLFKSSPPSVKG